MEQSGRVRDAAEASPFVVLSTEYANHFLAVQHLFDDETARGRVTVEVNGESRTLLSMRGQGLQESTKQIPALYSEAKRAVIGLRNQTPTLTVMGASRDPMSR